MPRQQQQQQQHQQQQQQHPQQQKQHHQQKQVNDSLKHNTLAEGNKRIGRQATDSRGTKI